MNPDESLEYRQERKQEDKMNIPATDTNGNIRGDWIESSGTKRANQFVAGEELLALKLRLGIDNKFLCCLVGSLLNCSTDCIKL